MSLSDKECVSCVGGVPPLKGDALKKFSAQLSGDWKVGELAEKQNHHPDIYLAWGKVKLTLWTHKVDGLTESDFVFAAKVEKL